MYKHWGKPVVNFDGSPLLWIHGYKDDWENTIHDHMAGILDGCDTSFYIGVLDGKGNFRKKVATKKKYKGTRNNERPPHFYELRKLLVDKYGFVIVNGVEADDYLGICHCQLSKPVCQIPVNGTMKRIYSVTPLSYISTIDKDLRSINGYHSDLKNHRRWEVRDEWSYIELSPKRNKLLGQGFKFHYAQILTGDTVDNIPGLPKCGPVKAFNLLNGCNTKEECQEVVKQAYIDKFGEEEGLIQLKEQTKLIKILTRHHDVPSVVVQDFNNRVVKFRDLTLF